MANTYYKYVDREVESQVNWAEIGKNMTDMLSNEAREREEKKAALDQATRDQLKVLSEPPTGDNESARIMGIKFGDSASQYLRMQDQLLKSGQLKLADYMVGRQNVVDDTENLFGMLKDYQATYKEKMDRRNADDSQEWELASMEIIEGFGNFSQSQPYIDPATGRVSMAMMEKKVVDGKEVYVLSDKPNKTATITTVKGLLQGKWDRFDSEAALDAINARIGENIETIRSFGRKNVAGEVKTISDTLASVREEAAIEAEIKIKQAKSDLLKGNTDKKSIDAKAKLESEIAEAKTEILQSKAIFDFQKYEDKSIEQNFTNVWNRLSVLTNSMGTAPDGNPYDFVYSEEEQKKDPIHNIYMKPSNDNSGSLVPDFTKEQQKDSLDFMRNQLRARYNKKESVQTVNEYQPSPQQQQWQSENKDNKVLHEEIGRMLGYLHGGTQEEIQTAVEYFDAMNPGMINQFKRDDGGMSFYNDKGGFIKISNTNKFDDWIRAGFKAVAGNAVGEEEAVKKAKSIRGLDKELYQSWDQGVNEAGEKNPPLVFKSKNQPAGTGGGGGGGMDYSTK